MKKIIFLISALTIFLLPIVSFGGTPIENDVLVNKSLRNRSDILETLVKLVNAHDYSCDSISAVDILMFSTGYDLSCNKFSYRYLVEDKGGKWIVTVK